VKDYPRFWRPGNKPFNPLKLAEKTEKIVCRREENKVSRKYTHFYVAGVYRGIVTACGVGCCLRCFYCWVPLSRDYPEHYGKYYTASQVVQNIVKLARKYRVKKARISCCEPTISREHLLQVLDLIEEAKEIKLFILETNGMIFGVNKSFVKEVLDYSKVYVRVSIKAGEPEDLTWRTGADGDFYELPFKAVEYFNEEAEPLKRFHVAAMTDSRIMSSREREKIIRRLWEINPILAITLEEEIVDPYDTTLIRLEKAGVKIFK